MFSLINSDNKIETFLPQGILRLPQSVNTLNFCYKFTIYVLAQNIGKKSQKEKKKKQIENQANTSRFMLFLIGEWNLKSLSQSHS